MFIAVLLVFLLVNVIAGQEPGDKTPLSQSMTKVFEEFNLQYKPPLVWDDYLAGEALKESMENQSVKANLKITTTREFRNNDRRTPEERLKATIEKRFKKRGSMIEDLRDGSRYGCNGVSYSKRDGYTTITATCVYCEPQSTVGVCYKPR